MESLNFEVQNVQKYFTIVALSSPEADATRRERMSLFQ
jgi:hypothetical protein